MLLTAASLIGVALQPAGYAPARAETPTGDAGSGGDAGGTFETATPIQPSGAYSGQLRREADDVNDYYRFFLPAGASTSILVTFDALVSDPVVILDPEGRPVDTGTTAFVGASGSNALTTEVYPVRVAVHHAVVAGEYRLRISSEHVGMTKSYQLCFMNCERPMDAPIEFIFGGSLKTTDARVLLVPPAHGDLGNPSGPTVLEYIDATIRGIRSWERALKAFAADHPDYWYLARLSVHIEVFDGVEPVDPAGYDVVVGYVAAGPAFRGVAVENPTRSWIDAQQDFVRVAPRFIALSLFGASPRAGQVLPDFPEVSDLESVTMHEFGHTFGLGHTRTWHAEHGPDLMNSPATFVYGDGAAAGDGGERTPLDCFSSLDLYGMAVLYRWAPSGRWVSTWGSTTLPPSVPYKLYC